MGLARHVLTLSLHVEQKREDDEKENAEEEGVTKMLKNMKRLAVALFAAAVGATLALGADPQVRTITSTVTSMGAVGGAGAPGTFAFTNNFDAYNAVKLNSIEIWDIQPADQTIRLWRTSSEGVSNMVMTVTNLGSSSYTWIAPATNNDCWWNKDVLRGKVGTNITFKVRVGVIPIE